MLKEEVSEEKTWCSIIFTQVKILNKNINIQKGLGENVVKKTETAIIWKNIQHHKVEVIEIRPH